jgi:hypothetical protein
MVKDQKTTTLKTPMGLGPRTYTKIYTIPSTIYLGNKPPKSSKLWLISQGALALDSEQKSRKTKNSLNGARRSPKGLREAFQEVLKTQRSHNGLWQNTRETQSNVAISNGP